MKVLECSSKGDKRFSAFSARVEVFGKMDSIENHYQMSKRIGDFAPRSWRDIKGKNVSHFEIAGVAYPKSMLTAWYKLLWLKYLRNHPKLVEFADGYDEFNDMFAGRAINNQADVIRTYVKKGESALMAECTELIEMMSGN